MTPPHTPPRHSSPSPSIVDGGPAVHVGCPGVGSVDHQQLCLQDLPGLGGHVQRRGPLLLRVRAASAPQPARRIGLQDPPSPPPPNPAPVPRDPEPHQTLTGWKKLAWAPSESRRRQVSRLPVRTLECNCCGGGNRLNVCGGVESVPTTKGVSLHPPPPHLAEVLGSDTVVIPAGQLVDEGQHLVLGADELRLGGADGGVGGDSRLWGERGEERPASANPPPAPPRGVVGGALTALCPGGLPSGARSALGPDPAASAPRWSWPRCSPRCEPSAEERQSPVGAGGWGVPVVCMCVSPPPMSPRGRHPPGAGWRARGCGAGA